MASGRSRLQARQTPPDLAHLTKPAADFGHAESESYRAVKKKGGGVGVLGFLASPWFIFPDRKVLKHLLFYFLMPSFERYEKVWVSILRSKEPN